MMGKTIREVLSIQPWGEALQRREKVTSINLRALSPQILVVLTAFMLVIMTSCGGGGGSMIEPNTTDWTANGLEPYGSEMLRLEVDWPQEMSFVEGEVRHVTARVYAKTARPGQGTQVIYQEEELTLLGFVTWRCTIGSRAADHQSAGPQAGWEIDWREEFAGRQMDVTVVVEVDPEGLADHIASRFTNNGGTVQRREGRGRRGILGGLFGGLLIFAIQSAMVVDPTDHETKSASFASVPGQPGPTPQQPVLTKADLQPPTATVVVGNTVQLVGRCLDQFGNEVSGTTHTFTSSQPGIASVDSHGLVRGVMPGSATITFRCMKGNITVIDTSVITVVNPSVVFQPPVAVITANPMSGQAPLTVNFSAAGSHDPDGGTITRYEWDLDGNGSFEMNTGTNPNASRTYTSVGSVSVSVRVTDDEGAQDTASVTITVNQPTQQVTYELFVAGTKGPLGEGDMWEVDETGSQIVNVFKWLGSDGSEIEISPSSVQVITALPAWVYSEGGIYTTELMTAKWSQPHDPDVEDAGNMFIEPGIYDITFQVPAHSSGADNTRFMRLRVLDRPDFP